MNTHAEIDLRNILKGTSGTAARQEILRALWRVQRQQEAKKASTESKSKAA